MDEQRPQRQGYSDLNERQAEGVPALEEDEATSAQPDEPGLGPGDVSGRAPDEPNMVRQAGTNEGRLDDSTGSGQAEPAADDLAPAVDQGDAGSGGQRSGGDSGERSVTGG